MRAVELRPTIDREWLERAVERAPMDHAFALWDLVHEPERIRFVTARDGESLLGYLLVWLGRPDRPVVHWFGPLPAAAPLAGALPTPPFSALLPPEAAPLVTAPGGPGPGSPVLVLLRERGPVGSRVGSAEVRRLVRDDREALTAWAVAQGDTETDGYVGLDPDADGVWGAFDRGELVGVARAAVRLPGCWIVTGVYVEPSARRQGLGSRVVAAVVEAAEREGARVGLFVREDAGGARALYERLGFRPVGRRVWVEVARPGALV